MKLWYFQKFPNQISWIIMKTFYSVAGVGCEGVATTIYSPSFKKFSKDDAIVRQVLHGAKSL